MAMGTREVTARGRALGEELRRWRERAGLQAAELARQLSWSPTKVCNIEAGKRGVSEVDATMYLAYCRAPGSDVQELLEFFHEQKGYWLQPHGAGLSDELRSLITHETTAGTIYGFELAVIPGLLQTEDYVRALLTAGGLHPEEAIEPLVRARKDRQVLLRRQRPPTCTFFVDENALRMRVGSARIMNDQLLHLVFATSRPQIQIRVVPASAGPHAGLSGAFRLMCYPNQNPVAYVATEAASLFLDKPEITARYQEILDVLGDIALDERQSRSWLARVASEFDRPREDHDGQPRAEDAPLA